MDPRRFPSRADMYWRARERGMAHEDALGYADSRSARPAAPEPPRPEPQRPSILGGFARGAGYGARETAASYAGGASWLAGGEGSRLGQALSRAEESIAGGFQPQTTAEKAGRIVGRIGTELGAAITGGGLLVRGATAVPRLSRLAQALQSTSRIKRGAAYATTQAPLDVLMGARDETPLLLPERFGRFGAIAENVGITGAAGALFAPVRQARRAAEAAEEVPTTRIPETPVDEVPTAAARETRPRPTPAAEAAPRAAEEAADPIARLLEDRPAVYRKSDGALRFGFEDPADGAAYILSTNRKTGASTARRYLEGLGLNEDQIKDYARNVGNSLRKEARDYVFEQGERGSTVFYYVPRMGASEAAAVPAARAATPAKAARAARAARVTEAAVPEVPAVRPTGTAGFQVDVDAGETAFRQVLPEETVRRGAQTAVRSATGAPTPSASYAIVDASSITPSHSPRTFEWNDLYPQSMQQRDYSNIKSYQDAVNQRAANLNPDFLTDPTRSLQDGPPLISQTGLVIAGSDRSMSIMRAAELFPERYAQYVRRLEGAAESFGLSADAVRSVDNPVLVRIADEPLDVRQMREINRASDIADTKAFSGKAEARSRAEVFANASKSVEHFARTVDPEDTIRDYLSTEDGRRFVNLLTEEGVIPRAKLAELMSEKDSTVLSSAGRDFVARLITSAALKAADDMPDQILRKLEHATPIIAKMKSVPDWDVSSVADEAVDILTKARNTNLSIDAFLGQRSVFGEGDEVVFSPAAQAMARFIDGANKRDVTEAFRRLGKLADASGVEDMFGGVPGGGSLDEALESVFGVRPSVVKPEIASGVAGAALGGLAGATARDEEGEAQAGLGAIVGGALGGALGRSAGRRIAGDAGIIARGERTRPRPETFLGEVSRGRGPLAEFANRFRYNIVNETHPALLLVRHTLGRKAAERFDGMIARSAGSAQEAMQYMRDKYDPFFRNHTQEQRDQIANFAVIRRATESGLSINMSPEEVARQYAEGMANPVLKEGSDQLMVYFRDLLKMRYRAGLIPDADYARVVQSDDYYVPFAADFAAETRRKASRAAPGWNVRDTGVGSMNREAIRDWNIQDPLEVLMEATLATHADVAKRRAFNFIARAIDRAAIDIRQGKSNIGNFIYRVDPSSRSAFEANRFTAITNKGKRVTYEVRDPELFQAISQQNTLEQTIARELARGVADFKRAAIVLEPTFSLMQSIRDVPFYVAQRADFARGIRESAMGAAAGAVGGAITSEEDRILQNAISGALVGTGLGAAARPATELVKSLGHILRKDDVYKEWLRMGGSSEGIRIRNPKDAQEVLRQLERTGVDLNDVVNFRSWIDALKFIASVGEQVPRLAKYKEQIARGVDPSVAIRDSQAVTVRFASRGASKGLREVAAATPFFNAKIQGWDKLVQMAKDPKQGTMAGIVLLAPTVGLFMQNKDNPEYWDRPQWEKDLFWLVPKPGGGFFRVPKPFELGYIFSSLAERFLSYLAETGGMESAAPRKNVTATQAAARAGGAFLLEPAAQAFPMPTVLEVPLSQAMNFDFFRRRDLVPQYYERIESGEQALPYTGALPRAIGKATNVGPFGGISPIRTEKLLGDVGGTAYRRASEAIIDPLARMAGLDAPVQRTRDMGAGPAFIRSTGLSRFITREYDTTQVEADARSRLQNLEEKYQTLQMKINQRRPTEEIRAYQEENAEALSARNALNGFRSRLDRITAERRDLLRRRDLTPEERDARMEMLRRQGDFVSRKIVEYGAK